MSIRFLLHGFGQFDSRHPVGPAEWPHFDLLAIHDGCVMLRLADAEPIELSAGKAVLIYPRTPFQGSSQTASTRASVQHFAIDPAPPPPLVFRNLLDRRRGFTVHQTYPGFAAEVCHAMELASAEQTSGCIELRVARLMLIVGQLTGEGAPGPAKPASTAMDAVIDWAQAHLHRGVGVQDLARRAGLSASHFRSVFRRGVGQSAGQFLHALRMLEASRLLRETRTPVKQIARRVGYSHVVAFHHAFGRHAGMTPGAYLGLHAPRG